MQQVRHLSIFSIIGISSILAFSSPVTSHQPPLFAVLDGGNEVDTSGKANVGDPNGFGSASVTITLTNNPELARLCYGLTAQRTDQIVAAHIHEGNAGVNGPIVVTLAPPLNGSSSDCLNIPLSLAQQIQHNSRGFYVNVHTTQFPGGAIRGQLF